MTEPRKTRVVYFNHTGLVSGAERVLVNILRVLDRTRYEAFVLCPSDGELAELVKREGVLCLSVPQIRARFTRRPDLFLQYVASLIKAVFSVRKRILDLRPDIVHANSVRAGVVASLATMGKNRMLVWHVHDMLPSHPVSTMIRLVAYLRRRTCIVAVSNATAQAFCGGVPFGKRVRTIHNGTDLSKFPLKQPGKSSFRKDVGIPEDAFLICAIGQICSRKGLRELLEAFSRIYSGAPQTHLAIVGKAVFQHEERYRESLFDFVETAGISDRVHFTGEVHDVSRVLQAADLLVLNSHREPFGLVLIEAMSSGTPVLATRVDGIPEIVTDSVNGCLVEQGDTAALAAKLLGLSQERSILAEFAQVAHRTTCPRFSMEQFKGDLHRFYAELDSKPDLQWKVRNQPVLARNGEK
jgi:glycosyltransferase involved in cell wall biosynthesis